MTIKEICERFRICGDYAACTQINNGIINKSYLVTYRCDGQEKKYLVQRINRAVFRRPDKIMQNVVGVTEFIRAKMLAQGIDPERRVLKYAETADKKNYVLDSEGNYWRLYNFIDDSVVYDEATDAEIIEQVGKAFGAFQNFLSDYDAGSLYVSIPNFHNTRRRYDLFYEAVMVDAEDRAGKVKREIDLCRSHETLATKLSIMAENKEIPLHVTHNDTKSNNVIFDREEKKALAVIDLDTVMPGLVAYDFGDAARFICSDAPEDELDLSKVKFNLEKFRALTKGFVGALKGRLTPIETDTLALGVYSMTVELAVRFLTDYLNGDTYFSTNYPGHNLDRAKCQLALADSVYGKLDAMREIVREYAK